jgi:hypothetical protein
MPVAKSRDMVAAICVVIVVALPLIVGFPRAVLDLTLDRPMLMRAIWIGSVIFLIVKNYPLTAILVTLLGLGLYSTVFSSYAYSPQGIMADYYDQQVDDPRFNQYELDRQIADETLVRDPPRMLDQPRKRNPLLLFPPSLDQLKMIGSNGHSV